MQHSHLSRPCLSICQQQPASLHMSICIPSALQRTRDAPEHNETPCRGEYCTVSSDGTFRGWDIASHAQLFELAAPGEVIQCCAYHPDRHELACGFDQGRVRIFDIAETALLQEHKQHRQGVVQVLYLPSGKLLFSLGELPFDCFVLIGLSYKATPMVASIDYPAKSC